MISYVAKITQLVVTKHGRAEYCTNYINANEYSPTEANKTVKRNKLFITAQHAKFNKPPLS